MKSKRLNIQYNKKMLKIIKLDDVTKERISRTQ